MKSNEINEFIKNYILSSKLRSALMINGAWGIGKSFYIENELVPYLKRECDFDIVQISLYGITSIQELTKQIYLEIRAKKLVSKNEKLVAGKLIAKAVFNGVAGFFNVNTNISESDFQELYQSLDLTNKVLIFEDLERSHINITEALGFINTLVDQDKVKVILVANENEIAKNELKYNEETKKMEFLYTKDAERYLQIKEKTISETILFSVDLENSILSIAKIFDNQILNSILTGSILQRIIKDLQKSNHENLRTIIFAFQKTIDIFNMITEKQEEFVYNKILEDTLDISISLKSGNDTNSKEEIKNKILNDFSNKSTYFCCAYVINQKIDKTSILDGISEIVKENEIQNKKKVDHDLDTIRNFYIEDDKNVLECFNNILKKLKKKEFPSDQIGTLISYSVFLKDHVGFDYEEIKSLIFSYSDIVDIKNLHYASSIVQNGEEKNKEYNNFIQEFELLIKEKDITNTEKDLNTLILNSNDFYEYVSKNEMEFLNKRKFMSLIQLEKIMEFIQLATNEDITRFRYSLQAVYRFSNIKDYYTQDIDSIYNIYLNIKNYLGNDKISSIKKLLISWLINDLEKLLINLGFNPNKAE